MQFPYPLNRGEDPQTGYPVLGFEHNGKFVFDPYRTPELTAPADPVCYGLDATQAADLARLNRSLLHALEVAVAAGAATLRHELQLGDAAESPRLHDVRSTRPVAEALAKYVLQALAAHERPQVRRERCAGAPPASGA